MDKEPTHIIKALQDQVVIDCTSGYGGTCRFIITPNGYDIEVQSQYITKDGTVDTQDGIKVAPVSKDTVALFI